MTKHQKDLERMDARDAARAAGRIAEFDKAEIFGDRSAFARLIEGSEAERLYFDEEYTAGDAEYDEDRGDYYADEQEWQEEARGI